MGLEIIQERRTRREARNVVRKGKTPALVLAELAIDRVIYTFKDTKLGLSEVEVEAKSSRSLATVRDIAMHWSQSIHLLQLVSRHNS